MKKVFLIAVIAALFTTMGVNAQGLKGTWFAGGNLSLGSDTNYESGAKVKTTDYTIMPLVGKFITPDLAVGGAIGYMYNKVGDAKDNTFIIQPLVRKYWNVTGKLYFFAQAALPITMSNNKVNGDKISDAASAGLQFTPGFDLILTSWLTLEASFDIANVTYTSSKPKGGDRSSNFRFNTKLYDGRQLGQMNVGVKILF